MLDGDALSEASQGSDATDAVDARDASAPVDAQATSDASVDRAETASDASTPDAAEAGPIDYLANPNFASSTLAGWTVVPPDAAQTTAFTQAPVGSATTPQGQAYELATYSASAAFTVDMSQSLTNLPDGTYTFSGWFNRGTNNQAYIYAKNCGGSDTAADDGGAGEVADIPLTSSTGWEQVTIAGIVVAGGSCQVGFYVDAAATDWLNADGFSFESVAPSGSDAGGLDATAD